VGRSNRAHFGLIHLGQAFSILRIKSPAMKTISATLFLIFLGLLVPGCANKKDAGKMTVAYDEAEKLSFTFVRKEMTPTDGWSVTVKLKNNTGHDINGFNCRLGFYENDQKITWTGLGISRAGSPLKKDAEEEMALIKGVATSIDKIVIYQLRLLE
jgi:hypothetical protein